MDQKEKNSKRGKYMIYLASPVLTEHDKKKLAEDNAWRNENFERNTKKMKQ